MGPVVHPLGEVLAGQGQVPKARVLPALLFWCLVARLRAFGTELLGEVAQYEDKYRLCYVRGPEGIIVALAEELS